MCGIMGVSFAPDSTLNRHKMLSVLLSEAEVRGRDSAGYAYVAPGGTGYYKKAIPGSKLHVGKLPADATAFIAHTRMATQGSPKDNDNNHPVLSPNKTITLVHNGVIYNDDDIRGMLGEVGKKLPEVDSSVIPAIIEAYGIDATEHLAGQAACAWFDTETDNTIHLARFNGSPISFAWLIDGSFVFASTDAILGKALDKLDVAWYGQYPGPFSTFGAGDYFQIMNGEIIQEAEVEWDTTYHRGWSSTFGGSRASGFSHVASEDKKPAALVIEPPKVGSTFLAGGEDVASDEEYAFWDQHGYFPGELAQALAEDAAKEAAEYTRTEENGELVESTTYYVEEHGGDETNYPTLVQLVANLRWFAGLTSTEDQLVDPDEGDIRWVNTVLDVGHIGEDGQERISWVRNKGAMESIGELPEFVRDGVDKLRTLVGA